MKARKLTRRDFLHASALAAASTVIAACSAPTAAPVSPTAAAAPTEAAKPAVEQPTTAPEVSTSKYNEAPMLSEKVKAGSLPPDQRAHPRQSAGASTC